MVHLQDMFLNVVRQQIPQQVPLTQGYYIGHRQAGPDDLVQQLAADLGHHGPLIAAEGGGQIPAYGIRRGGSRSTDHSSPPPPEGILVESLLSVLLSSSATADL